MANEGEWSYIGEAWPHRGGRGHTKERCGPFKRGSDNHYKLTAGRGLCLNDLN